MSGQLLRGKWDNSFKFYPLENGICLIKGQLSYSICLENNEANEYY